MNADRMHDVKNDDPPPQEKSAKETHRWETRLAGTLTGKRESENREEVQKWQSPRNRECRGGRRRGGGEKKDSSEGGRRTALRHGDGESRRARPSSKRVRGGERCGFTPALICVRPAPPALEPRPRPPPAAAAGSVVAHGSHPLQSNLLKVAQERRN